MASERSELEQRRGQLTRSLPGLSENRADTYRRNSDALALDRGGVKHERPEEMVRLGEAEVAADAAIRDVQTRASRHRRSDQTQATPWSRGEIRTHPPPSTRRPVSALPVTRRAVDVFDHPGLFMVRLDRPRAMSAAAKTHELQAMRPGRARVAPTDRHKGGLRRYCSGCAQETEHGTWAADGRGSTPSIRWPATEPAIGTTICLNCGQWRAASPQPTPRTWSSWPRSRIATPSLAVPADSADAADDWASETAAESEGMPPRREPRRRLRRSTARLRRPRAVAR
jgi:hypothetical protein